MIGTKVKKEYKTNKQVLSRIEFPTQNKSQFTIPNLVVSKMSKIRNMKKTKLTKYELIVTLK